MGLERPCFCGWGGKAPGIPACWCLAPCCLRAASRLAELYRQGAQRSLPCARTAPPGAPRCFACARSDGSRRVHPPHGSRVGEMGGTPCLPPPFQGSCWLLQGSGAPVLPAGTESRGMQLLVQGPALHSRLLSSDPLFARMGAPLSGAGTPPPPAPDAASRAQAAAGREDGAAVLGRCLGPRVLCGWGFCHRWSSLGFSRSQDWLGWGDMGWQSPVRAGQGQDPSLSRKGN